MGIMAIALSDLIIFTALFMEIALDGIQVIIIISIILTTIGDTMVHLITTFIGDYIRTTTHTSGVVDMAVVTTAVAVTMDLLVAAYEIVRITAQDQAVEAKMA